MPWGEFRVATPGYFEALRIPLIRGRTFMASDDATGRPVAIVDRVLAERYWPGEEAIGQRVAFDRDDPGNPIWHEVVGVVGHVRSAAVEPDPKTQLYVPFGQMPEPHMALVVRGAGDPSSLIPAVREAVLRVDPDQPVYSIQTMESLVADSVARRRFVMLLLVLFGALALVLAAVGVYGVMSYTVAQRAREMGIRMALRAQPRTVVGLVLRQGMSTALLGVAIGVAGAVALARLLRSQLYEVSPSDPLTFAAAVVVFMAVAALATYVLARRAAAVDPGVTLRAE